MARARIAFDPALLATYPHQGSPLVDAAHAATPSEVQALLAAAPQNGLTAVAGAHADVRWQSMAFQEAAASTYLLEHGWSKVNEARYDGDFNHVQVKGRGPEGLTFALLEAPVAGDAPEGYQVNVLRRLSAALAG